MSEKAKHRAIVAGLIIGLAAVAAVLLPLVASSDTGGVRELRIVARDMAFYVDGQSEPNPTIVLRAGEQVRVHLRNEEAGMRHDFVVKAWNVASEMLEDRGDEDTFVLTAPPERGMTTYLCTPHAKMMRGMLRVE